MHQADLLADLPRARNTDPETSHLAARKVRDSGALGRQQRAVLYLVQRYPGHTSAELAKLYVKTHDCRGGTWSLFRPMVARRLPELEPVHIRRGEARECAITGAVCLTWWGR